MVRDDLLFPLLELLDLAPDVGWWLRLDRGVHLAAEGVHFSRGELGILEVLLDEVEVFWELDEASVLG